MPSRILSDLVDGSSMDACGGYAGVAQHPGDGTQPGSASEHVLCLSSAVLLKGCRGPILIE